MLSGGLPIHGGAYLEMPPNMYYCYGNQTPCTPKEFCNQTTPIVYRYSSVDFDYEVNGQLNTNVFNFYTERGLVCKPNARRFMSTVGASAILGVAVGCLFVPRLADLKGRKPIFLATLII